MEQDNYYSIKKIEIEIKQLERKIVVLKDRLQKYKEMKLGELSQ